MNKLLSKKQIDKIITFVDKIFKNNYILINSSTFTVYKNFKSQPNFKNFKLFCFNIDFFYEYIKKILKYPKRSFIYKFNNSQYINSWIGIMFYFLYLLVFLTLTLLISFSIINLIKLLITKII